MVQSNQDTVQVCSQKWEILQPGWGRLWGGGADSGRRCGGKKLGEKWMSEREKKRKSEAESNNSGKRGDQERGSRHPSAVVGERQPRAGACVRARLRVSCSAAQARMALLRWLVQGEQTSRDVAQTPSCVACRKRERGGGSHSASSPVVGLYLSSVQLRFRWRAGSQWSFATHPQHKCNVSRSINNNTVLFVFLSFFLFLIQGRTGLNLNISNLTVNDCWWLDPVFGQPCNGISHLLRRNCSRLGEQGKQYLHGFSKLLSYWSHVVIFVLCFVSTGRHPAFNLLTRQ